jgi:Holliday junction resolvasome RuvABC endonuclease subunit
VIVAGVDYDSFGVYLALVDAGDYSLADLAVIRFRDKSREADKSYAFPAAQRIPEALTEALFIARRKLWPRLAYVERGFSPKGQQRQAFGLGRVQGLIVAALLEHDVPVDELTPAEWRKELGVPGNCSKAEAHLALLGVGAPFYGEGDPRLVADENVRDALAIAYAGARRNARGAS